MLYWSWWFTSQSHPQVHNFSFSFSLLILDEIDQLETKKQNVLYSIFEWPSLPDAKLVLVGIANALDLTDRVLPRLQAKLEKQPQLLHFAPYTKQQIIDIICERFKEVRNCNFFLKKLFNGMKNLSANFWRKAGTPMVLIFSSA